VAVNIELGHTARVLQHVTKEGFTHEWSVWVRGENDRSLADVVEKVVFNLHESFKRPKRSEYLSFMICNAFYFPAV
jgi:YEATS domain-containing protein 1/3